MLSLDSLSPLVSSTNCFLLGGFCLCLRVADYSFVSTRAFRFLIYCGQRGYWKWTNTPPVLFIGRQVEMWMTHGLDARTCWAWFRTTSCRARTNGDESHSGSPTFRPRLPQNCYQLRPGTKCVVTNGLVAESGEASIKERQGSANVNGDLMVLYNSYEYYISNPIKLLKDLL